MTRPPPRRIATLLGTLARGARRHIDWIVYVAVALVCTEYLDTRAALVTKWGDWYMAMGEGQPNTFLQIRAFLAGRLSVLPHSLGAVHDHLWGRGGMHQAWGLGVPLLATPFHLVGLLFGAPGFPDAVRFLLFYGATTVVLVRALHRVNPGRPDALATSAAAGGLVMVLPNFVGLISARFLTYEHTIAMGALWSLLMLSGVLGVARRATLGNLVALCAAAGFAVSIRPTLAAYGLTSLALGLLLAHRQGLRPRALVAGLSAYGSTAALYFVANWLRFGSPLTLGYANVIAGPKVNRLHRWGLSFHFVPLGTKVKELFASLFLLGPVGAQTAVPPPVVAPYALGERWREYYTPTFDPYVISVWAAAVALVVWRAYRHRPWRRDAESGTDVITLLGVWSIPPALALFGYYTVAGHFVTRYADDLYPAFAAATLCVGMGVVEAVDRRAPQLTSSAHLAIAAACGLYLTLNQGWPTHMARSIDRKTLLEHIAAIDEAVAHPTPPVPDHFVCGERRPALPPVHWHLKNWHDDCGFESGMTFAMPHSPCVKFSLGPSGASWSPEDEEALAGIRATADSDPLVACGKPAVLGETRAVTMCDPGPPPYLLDGMRLYSLATLDARLDPIDRLKLQRIDAEPACGGETSGR